MAQRSRTLLEPGHDAEWAELNREKREYHHRTARLQTPSERVAEGQGSPSRRWRCSPRRSAQDMSLRELSGPDLEGVAAGAIEVDVGGESAKFANLRSIVGFKRLAGRPQDKRDLEELASLHGELPIDPIPGLDS